MTLRYANGFGFASDAREKDILFPEGWGGNFNTTIETRNGIGNGPQGCYLVADEFEAPYWIYNFRDDGVSMYDQYFGFAVYFANTIPVEDSAFYRQAACEFKIGGTILPQCYVTLGKIGNNDRAVGVWGYDGVLMGNSGGLAPQRWYYIEVKMGMPSAPGADDGQWEIRVNETSVASGAGKTFASNNPASFTEKYVFYSPRTFNQGASFFLGDFYYLDSHGGGPYNTFIGDHIATHVIPADADDTPNQWTASNGGAKYLEIDDFPDVDDDGSYISTLTAGHQQVVETTSTIADGGVAAEVVNMNIFGRCKLQFNNGTRIVRPIIKTTDGTYIEPVKVWAISDTTYQANFTDLAFNPITVNPWSVADFSTKNFRIGLEAFN